jgi:hypothetical protein
MDKNNSVGVQMNGKYKVDDTQTPATLAIYFDDDPHYPHGFALRAIIELVNPGKLRIEVAKPEDQLPKKFSDKAGILDKQ